MNRLRGMEGWIEYLDLTNGIPAHDTLGRVFGQLDGASFSDCFVVWMSGLAEQQGKQIAIDGKIMCGSRDKAIGREAIDMVSAFAVPECHPRRVTSGCFQRGTGSEVARVSP